MDEIELYKKAIGKFGVENRFDHLVEECGEVITARNHVRRGRAGLLKFLNELVDIEISLSQVKLIFSEKDWQRAKKNKLKKFQKAVNKEI